MTMRWQAQVACFVVFRSLKRKKKKNLCTISSPESTTAGQKPLCEVAVRQRAALCAVQLCCCRGLFNAWNRMVSREHSGGWALQCTAVLVALLCTPTLFQSCSASLTISPSLALSLALSCPYLCRSPCLPPLHHPPIAFVSLMPTFPHTLSKLTAVHVFDAVSHFRHLHHPAPHSQGRAAKISSS